MHCTLNKFEKILNNEQKKHGEMEKITENDDEEEENNIINVLEKDELIFDREIHFKNHSFSKIEPSLSFICSHCCEETGEKGCGFC
jgi:hypothetical protein